MNRPAAPNSRKRKRTPSSSTAAARNATTTATTGSATAGTPVINPLSHTPSTVKQFKVAGLSIDAPLPSKIYPGFPHRSIPPPSKPKASSSRNKWESFYSSEVDVDDTDGEGEGYESGTSQVEGETPTGNEDNLIQASASHAGNEEEEEEEEHIPGRRRRQKSTKQDLRPKKSVVQREAGLAAAERAQAHKKHVGGLLQIIERGLMEGNVTTAKRAFGLLVRSKVYGTPVDLRYADYWKLGLDILLREGEEEDKRRRKRRRRRLKKRVLQLSGNMAGQQEEEDDEIDGFDEEEDGFGDDEDEEEVEYKFARKRAADILTKVKAYYETLIKLFPYSRIRPTALSSLSLYPAMFQFELDYVRTEYDQGVQRLERIRRLGGFGDEEDEDAYGYGYSVREDLDGQQYGDDGMMDVDDHEADHHHHRSPILRERSTKPRGIIDQPADKLRQKALARVTDIAHRMDQILPNLPFKTDYTLLSLRAEIALLMADLSVPCLLEKETTAATKTTTPSNDNVPLSSPSQQLQQEQDRHRRSSSPEPEDHEDDDPRIKYEFEQEERAQVQEGKILRHKAQMKALKILTRMRKTVVKKGGLLDKEDEAVLAKLRKELLLDEKGDLDGGKREKGGNYYSDESESGSGSGGSDKEGGSQDGDDEAGGELLAQGQNRKEKKRQKEKDKGKKKARRAAEAGGFPNMSTSTTAGRGMFSSLPIR